MEDAQPPESNESKKKLTIIYSALLVLSLGLLALGYMGRSADEALRAELAQHGEARTALVTELNTDSSSTTTLRQKQKGITLTDHFLAFQFKERAEDPVTDRLEKHLDEEKVEDLKSHTPVTITGTDYVRGDYYDTLQVGSKVDILFVPSAPAKVKILDSDGEPYFLPYAGMVFGFGLAASLCLIVQLWLYRKKGIKL